MLQKVLLYILTVLRRFVEKKTVATTKISEVTPKSKESGLKTSTQDYHTVDPGSREDQKLETDQELKLSELYPPFATVVRQFIIEARKRGMNVAIYEGLRTFERQAALFAKGRDTSGRIVNKKLIVTRAKPGRSFHQYGLAVDIVFDENIVKAGWQWSWDDRFPWEWLAKLGESFGLEAARFWSTFPEAPHYQQTFGLSTEELLAWYNKAGLEGVWTRIDEKLARSKSTTNQI